MNVKQKYDIKGSTWYKYKDADGEETTAAEIVEFPTGMNQDNQQVAAKPMM